MKRRRLEEDVGAMRSRGAGTVALEESQAELKLYRGMVSCNICNKNNKDTIISKCFHMFCRSCVDKNLESRHRKCPSCGLSFGQNDVKAVYF